VNVLELTRLGANHVRNAVAEEIYLRTGRDMTVPVSIYGEVIELQEKDRACAVAGRTARAPGHWPK
jgi:hypothetical protein